MATYEIVPSKTRPGRWCVLCNGRLVSTMHSSREEARASANAHEAEMDRQHRNLAASAKLRQQSRGKFL